CCQRDRLVAVRPPAAPAARLILSCPSAPAATRSSREPIAWLARGQRPGHRHPAVADCRANRLKLLSPSTKCGPAGSPVRIPSHGCRATGSEWPRQRWLARSEGSEGDEGFAVQQPASARLRAV